MFGKQIRHHISRQRSGSLTGPYSWGQFRAQATAVGRGFVNTRGGAILGRNGEWRLGQSQQLATCSRSTLAPVPLNVASYATRRAPEQCSGTHTKSTAWKTSCHTYGPAQINVCATGLLRCQSSCDWNFGLKCALLTWSRRPCSRRPMSGTGVTDYFHSICAQYCTAYPLSMPTGVVSSLNGALRGITPRLGRPRK